MVGNYDFVQKKKTQMKRARQINAIFSGHI
jgi:hypothetical protein